MKFISIRVDEIFILAVLAILAILLVLHMLIRRKSDKLLSYLELAISQSPISIVITDKAGIIVYVNQFHCDLTGYVREELIGQKPGILRNQEAPRTDYDEMWALISRGKEWNGYFHNRRKDGTPFTEKAVIRPVFTRKGDIRGYLGVKEDVTEKLKQEERRSMLLSAIEQTEDVVEILDRNRKIVFVNQAFTRRYGYEKDEILGKDPIGIFDDGSRDNIRQNDDLWKTLDRGETWKGRFTNRGKEGDYFEEMVSISPIVDSLGDASYFVSVKKDISDIIRLSDERDFIREELYQNQKLETMGQLITGIAHDFNNIISGIMSSSQLLKKKTADTNPDVLKYLDRIFTNCDRAAQLSSQLLNYTQKSRKEKEKLDLCEEIKDIVSLLEQTVKKDITFSFDNYYEDSTLYFERSLLHNIILNLTVNAVHSIAESGEIHIGMNRVELDEPYCRASDYKPAPGSYIQISVGDNGSGIPGRDLKKIFDSFYTTKRDGAGLGLATVRRIVTENKGAMEVESEPGSGSTFSILLPLQEI